MKQVEYTLREGECLTIHHEAEEVRLTKEQPVALRPIGRL
jgi:alpha,alpha-trehalose phosphorylase